MANISEVMDHNASRRRASKSKPELTHLQVTKAADGGHVVEHFMRGGEESIGASEPKVHAFSHDERKAMVPEGTVLHHIAKTLNIPHEVTNAERGMEEAHEHSTSGGDAG
jgi:hypothetical protein